MFLRLGNMILVKILLLNIYAENFFLNDIVFFPILYYRSFPDHCPYQLNLSSHNVKL